MSGGNEVRFERQRIEDLLHSLERMASGDLSERIVISPARDELDALAHGVNVMAIELDHRFTELTRTQGELVQSGKLAALGELSSGLAHELNNPLAIALSYLEHLGDLARDEAAQPVDPQAALTLVGKIDHNLKRMSAMISHIMEFSRHSPPARQEVVLDEVIQKAFLLLGEQFRQKGVEVRLDLCRPSAATTGDALRLEQVCINLLTNARDAVLETHGTDGQGRIEIRTRQLPESREIELEISDNGTGMPPEVVDRIFNPFFTTKEVGKGTGLGLSIAHRIVLDHGGVITCASQPGQGTAFRIRFARR